MKTFFRLSVFFLLVFSCFRVSAQRQANIWHFGDGRCLDFSSGSPVNLSGSQIFAPEGSASYCDAFGNFLFYTNGGGREPLSAQNEGYIWNRNNAVMYNMQGTEGGGWSAKQSSLILEAPGQDSVYYVITMDELEWNVGASPPILAAQPTGRGLSYFTVDMRLNNGLGAVVLADQRIHTPSGEGLCAIRHANGRDYWIIINQDSTGFGVYSLTPSGVALSSVVPALVDQVFSSIKASPNGAYMAATTGDFITVPLQTVVYQFNNATGQLSNPVNLSSPTNPNRNDAWEFSPNSRYLYGFQRPGVNPPFNIVRYDLQAANIPASQSLVGTLNDDASGFQLAPDGKIYFFTGSFLLPTRALNRINCPNSANPSLEFSIYTYTKAVNDPFVYIGLPNFPAWLFENDDDTFVEFGLDTIRLCGGSGATVLDAKNPGATYLWSTGATTQTITVNTPGTYSVTVNGPCGIGSDEVVVVDCFSSAACDLISSSDTIRVCSGDTIQLQTNLSGYSNINSIKWSGGNGTFIPADTVASPRYVPSSSEVAQGALALAVRVEATVIDTSAPGRLLAYDHSGNDLIFAISPINGSIDSIQDNLGIDWVAMGFESSSSVLYGLSAFSSFSNVNIQTGVSSPVIGLSGEHFYAGEFDNVHGKYYAVGNIPSPSGSAVDQFLCTVNTSTGAYTIIGNLNLFTTNNFYYGDADGINGLAYDPGQDVLYGVTFNGKLYRIDVSTGAATFVGNTVNDMRGLAYDPVAAKLYGIKNNGTLHEINKNTGTLISTVNSQVPFSFVTSLTYARGANITPVVCYDTLNIIISPVPTFSLSTLNDSCSRITFPFSLNTNGNVNAVSWNFGDPGSGTSNSSSSASTSHTFSAPGNYTVSLIVNLECLIDTLLRNVNVLPQPVVSVSSDVSSIIPGDSARLTATGALNYFWSPSSGLSCANCPNPSAAPSGTTTYVLTGTNAQGCVASDSITIRVDIKCDELFLADIFTPDAMGPAANERLCVYGNCVRLLSLIIYNRWGEEVFETSELGSCWDGTYKGKDAMPGIYAYKLYVERIDGAIIDRKGTITLVR